jgi:O-antigen ligase
MVTRARQPLLPACVAVSIVASYGLVWFTHRDHRTMLLLGGLLACVVVALLVVEPFAGLLLLVVTTYLRPGDRFPVLQPLKPALLLAGLTTLVWLVQHIVAGRPPWARHRLHFWFAALLGTAVVSLVRYGPSLVRQLVGEGPGSSMLLAVLIANLASTPGRLRAVAWTVTLSCAANAVLAMQALAAGRSGFVGRAAGVGTMSDPNDLALTLVMVLPLALALWRGSPRRSSRALAGLLATLLVAGILATLSRGGLLALAVVGLAEVQATVPSPRLRRALTVAAAAAAIIGLNIMFAMRGAGLADVSRDPNAVSRKIVWVAGVRMMLNHPVRGVGLYQFGDAFADYKPRDLDLPDLTAHNSLILVLAELGLPGFFVFVSMLLLAREATRRVRRRALAGDLLAVPGGAAATPLCESFGRAYLGWFVAAMFLSQAYSNWLYLLLGMVVAADCQLRRLPAPEVTGSDPVVAKRTAS